MYGWIDANAPLLIGVIIVIAIVSIILIYIYIDDYPTVAKKYNHVFITFPESSFDLWSLSHLVLYFILGLIAPNYYITALVAGIGWEKVEAGLKGYDANYWYHKWDDLLVNLVGYIFGSAYRNTYYPIAM